MIKLDNNLCFILSNCKEEIKNAISLILIYSFLNLSLKYFIVIHQKIYKNIKCIIISLNYFSLS